MMYSDGVHLISSSSIEELHQWAKANCIKRHWFHNTQRFPHYDIPKKQRADFFTKHPDVTKVSSKEIVKLLNSLVKQN